MQSCGIAFVSQAGLLVATIGGSAVVGMTEVLSTYAIQDRNGRILPWRGYISSLPVLTVTFVIIGPLLAMLLSSLYRQYL